MTVSGVTTPEELARDLRISASHPALEGHFPGNPVVPGVVLLDEVLARVQSRHPGLSLAGLTAVKFLSPLRPDEPFSIRLERQGMAFQFECFTAERPLAKGSLQMREAAGSTR